MITSPSHYYLNTEVDGVLPCSKRQVPNHSNLCVLVAFTPPRGRPFKNTDKRRRSWYESVLRHHTKRANCRSLCHQLGDTTENVTFAKQSAWIERLRATMFVAKNYVKMRLTHTTVSSKVSTTRGPSYEICISLSNCFKTIPTLSYCIPTASCFIPTIAISESYTHCFKHICLRAK